MYDAFALDTILCFELRVLDGVDQLRRDIAAWAPFSVAPFSVAPLSVFVTNVANQTPKPELAMKRRTLIFTGHGKGKTTAALGMVLRAVGHGQRVLVVQFLKADASTGELAALRQLPGVEIVQMGRGFVPPEQSAAFQEHVDAAANALLFSKQALTSSNWDLIVLDEICGALAARLLAEEAVLELIRLPSRTATLVLTGRDASPLLIENADTVTEMRCVKHALARKFKAQEGVEF